MFETKANNRLLCDYDVGDYVVVVVWLLLFGVRAAG